MFKEKTYEIYSLLLEIKKKVIITFKIFKTIFIHVMYI